MAATNTGYLIQPRLKKVTADSNQFPLDQYNLLCSVTGNPQATMANPTSSPTYKIIDYVKCPITFPYKWIGDPSSVYCEQASYILKLEYDRTIVWARLRNSSGALITATQDITFTASWMSRPVEGVTSTPSYVTVVLVAGTSELKLVGNNPDNNEDTTQMSTYAISPTSISGTPITGGITPDPVRFTIINTLTTQLGVKLTDPTGYIRRLRGDAVRKIDYYSGNYLLEALNSPSSYKLYISGQTDPLSPNTLTDSITFVPAPNVTYKIAQ